MNLSRIIGAVSRELASREVDGVPVRVLVASRVYDTGIDDLWDALTSAERIPRWFLPISGELQLGGRYQLQGNAGGTILACEPPRRFRITWEFGGGTSWVTVTLHEESAGSTRMRLEHEAPVPPEMWEKFGPGAVGVGWDSGLLGLDQYFGTEKVVDPTTAMAWLATEEGKSFLRGSSEAWRDASIAFGTDPDAAELAARRTTAAYTGEDPDRIKPKIEPAHGR